MSGTKEASRKENLRAVIYFSNLVTDRPVIHLGMKQKSRYTIFQINTRLAQWMVPIYNLNYCSSYRICRVNLPDLLFLMRDHLNSWPFTFPCDFQNKHAHSNTLTQTHTHTCTNTAEILIGIVLNL